MGNMITIEHQQNTYYDCIQLRRLLIYNSTTFTSIAFRNTFCLCSSLICFWTVLAVSRPLSLQSSRHQYSPHGNLWIPFLFCAQIKPYYCLLLQISYPTEAKFIAGAVLGRYSITDSTNMASLPGSPTLIVGLGQLCGTFVLSYWQWAHQEG